MIRVASHVPFYLTVRRNDRAAAYAALMISDSHVIAFIRRVLQTAHPHDENRKMSKLKCRKDDLSHSAVW